MVAFLFAFEAKIIIISREKIYTKIKREKKSNKTKKEKIAIKIQKSSKYRI